MSVLASLLLLFLLRSCQGQRESQQYDLKVTSTPNPSQPTGSEPTHISEFTDPKTGLNPFVDLPEGRPGSSGRSIVKDQPIPDPFVQPVEGGPLDRGGWPVNPRWQELEEGSVEEGYTSRALRPPPENEDSIFHPDVPMEADGDGRNWDPIPSETTDQEPWWLQELTPSSTSRSLESEEQADVWPSTESSAAEYGSDYPEVELESQQEVTSQPERLPLSVNIMISAVITGVAVAFFAVLLAVCMWRQRAKRTATRGVTFIEDGESRSSDSSASKNGGANVLLRKQ